jgi:hypothetical protein
VPIETGDLEGAEKKENRCEIQSDKNHAHLEISIGERRYSPMIDLN